MSRIVMEKPKDNKFELGKVVLTRSIYEKCLSDGEFFIFVGGSLDRYMKCDWGDTCEEDAEQNDISVKEGERILAVYTNPKTNETIWIITEWDRSATTILFPSEY